MSKQWRIFTERKKSVHHLTRRPQLRQSRELVTKHKYPNPADTYRTRPDTTTAVLGQKGHQESDSTEKQGL